MLPDRKKAAHISVIVAVGANLPAPDGCCARQTCQRAVQAMAGLAGVSAVVCSRWFSSAPVPPSCQPRYINGVVKLGWDGGPSALLAALQAVENGFGRHRSVPDAARTLDLDIIDFDGLTRRAPDPILPHPRAHLRAFVLRPLRDVDPDWVHPVTFLHIDALLAALPPQDIRPA